MLKIYLAGPFFNDKQINLIETIEFEFDKYGFDYFSPRKGGGVISHLSPEDRTKESKRIYESNVKEMINANVLFAVTDGRDTGTVYEMGYFKALTDHFKYKSDKSERDLKRYSITCTNENFGLNIMLKESVDAHIVGERELKNFCGICAGNWDPPVGKENEEGWGDNYGRRGKILSQFQNFNPDVI
jgi:nucleoside 2-deoxyribosyltransferase|tara:strand:+ start:1727 stop:2284 length:558 start_codon:yes stop_codon:yes gene_type:complete